MKEAGCPQKGNIVKPDDILTMIKHLKDKENSRSKVFGERVEKYYNSIVDQVVS